MDEKDLKMYKAFRVLLNKGRFELQGDAVVMAASLFNWFNQLENKIRLQITGSAFKDAIITPIEVDKPKKKKGKK